MNENRNNSGTAGGIGFCGLLTIAFIILKLTGVISWSWLWVLAPIWIPTVIVLAVLLVVLIVSRSGNELHPTQKPVELLEKLVDNTDFARGVYDPFGGSGTTLAACEAYGQPSYTMELTPAFTDVIVKRYIRITGKQNVRCVRQGRELSREEIAGIFDPDEEGGGQE